MVDASLGPALYRLDRGWTRANLGYQLEQIARLCRAEDAVADQRLRRAVAAGLRFNRDKELASPP